VDLRSNIPHLASIDAKTSRLRCSLRKVIADFFVARSSILLIATSGTFTTGAYAPLQRTVKDVLGTIASGAPPGSCEVTIPSKNQPCDNP
jgi:hypothetical protein